MERAIPTEPEDVADRIARQTLAARGPDYSGEVRRLLDAGREVMRRNGTTARARVADIVAAAGLSNDAFYRHFASKDALVAAILEDGTVQLKAHLAEQMDRDPTPEGKVRRWIDGVLGQARDPDVAAMTLAVLWNAGSVPERPDGPSASTPLGSLLEESFALLGSADPRFDASLVAHAVVGTLWDLLWQGARPRRADTDHLVAFCLAAVTGAGGPTPAGRAAPRPGAASP